ncbi:hypothetical protein SI859A1_03481 [Aurantimonas manganoxydans SI85-9A1]|uniref:Uncharacterized protein n=1 Tax=Aurantimonas manganoxydans (strain ATCC BAA-1229 / DSM 21871 / SI85-9A1) TaxID=287752 RepID=Q1YEQ2_AURMS|nr:hypothetical protein SI859A1_03481 [Aurantimonas manganoxydans SI85-9A1]
MSGTGSRNAQRAASDRRRVTRRKTSAAAPARIRRTNCQTATMATTMAFWPSGAAKCSAWASSAAPPAAQIRRRPRRTPRNRPDVAKTSPARPATGAMQAASISTLNPMSDAMVRAPATRNSPVR